MSRQPADPLGDLAGDGAVGLEREAAQTGAHVVHTAHVEPLLDDEYTKAAN